MPGCEKLEQISDNEFEGILKIKVGPVQGTFNGKIILTDVNEPQSYNITIDGKGAPGFVKGQGGVQLVEENGRTILQYEGDAQVGGRLASVGQRLLDTSARAIVRQGLEGLDQQVQARVAPPANGTTTEPFAPPPTQVEFAAGVAKNIMDDILAEENRDELVNKLIIGFGAFLVLSVIINWFADIVANKVARKLEKK